ncbi:MAG TPA: hypothetical protein VFM95_09805 [Microcella sp.]|nr:hypothetical protein [Microcella sp.]
MTKSRNSGDAASDAGGIRDVRIELREPVHASTEAGNFSPCRSALERPGLSSGVSKVARAGDPTEVGKSFMDARHGREDATTMVPSRSHWANGGSP